MLNKQRESESEEAVDPIGVKFSTEVEGKLDSLQLEDFTVNEQREFWEFVKNMQEIEVKEWVPWWKHYEEVDEEGRVEVSYSNLVEEVEQHREDEEVLIKVNFNEFLLYDEKEEVEEETEEGEGNVIMDAFKELFKEIEEDDKEDGKIRVVFEDRETKENKEYVFDYKDKIRLFKLRFKTIKDLSEITKKKPSELIKYHIVNTVF